MKQVVYDASTGDISVVDVPRPLLGRFGALIALEASVISSGTERAKIEMGQRSLLNKARARPDLARKVVEQARKEGIRDTVSLVRQRLGAPQPLGYSAAGHVVEVGPEAKGIAPGDLVACGGAGFANHAELVYVPATLCAAVPTSLTAEQAAFATVASIALHGLRQADLEHGDRVLVSGLGLIGQLAVRLSLAYGHQVVGVDPSPVARQELALLGVPVFAPDDFALSGMSADAVLLTAATRGSELIQQAPTWCRDRGKVVVVGDIGLDLARDAYYEREIELRFSRSYGPGRYDPQYEDKARDYPVGYVRWTEGRNLSEVLRLMSDGRLSVDDLVTERYPIDRAPEAYARLTHGDRVRALLLTFPTPIAQRHANISPLKRPSPVGGDRLCISVCGAGNFARKTLLPALNGTGRVEWGAIATATGLTAAHVATEYGFRAAVSDPSEAATHPASGAVLVATRHDTHAELAGVAASASKYVFVEKPLAISREQLDDLIGLRGTERIVTGFNRRWAPPTIQLKEHLRTRTRPLLIQIRVNAGPLPPDHWADDGDQGGRLVGELCHFLDLACYLVGDSADLVTAAGGARRAPRSEDTVQTLLSFRDGSSASIAYFPTGSRSLPKERVEAHWDGLSFIIDDFRTWTEYGSRSKKHRTRTQDKGHHRLLSEFVRFALEGGTSPVPFHQAVHITDLSLAVIEALESRQPLKLGTATW